MTGALAIDGLSAGYRDHKVLDAARAPAIAPGSICALLGQNGAGKSTLLKALAGQLAFSGGATLGEMDIATLDHAARLRHVGYLPQTPIQESTLLAYEYALSVLQVGGFGTGNGSAVAAIEKIFRLLELDAFAMRPVSELSGGKRQLLGLGCVLARHPDLMLLDEPTSALDLRWQIDVLDILRSEVTAMRNVALVSVHDVNLALRFCDTAILLAGGTIIAAGPVQEVVTPDALRTAYGVEARIEHCSRGHPIALIDRTSQNRFGGSVK